jgi:Na+-driven multidrug efflux pump
MSLFTDNKEIIHTGSQLLLLCLILELGRTFNLVVINSLRATGDATLSRNRLIRCLDCIYCR